MPRRHGQRTCSRDRESPSRSSMARWSSSATRSGTRLRPPGEPTMGPPHRPYDRSASASPLKLTTHIFGQNSVPKFVKKGDASHRQILDPHRQFPHANDCCVVDSRRDSGRRSWPTPRGAATRQCPPRVRAASGWHVQSDD